MHLLLGILGVVMGGAYLAMAIKDRFASDKAGRVLARRDSQPVAYWFNVVLFTCMAVGGVGLILISFDL